MSRYGYDPERASLDQSQDVLPASQYLQQRLQEQRRVRNTGPKRSRHTDFGPQKGRDDDIFLNEADRTNQTRQFDSSPMARSTKGSDAGGSSAGGRRRTLGLRDMDSQMDKLTKDNFALKLELDHRREHTQKLQAQIESMKEAVAWAEHMQEEHQELMKINSEIVAQLEQRDKAVEEAMDLICGLEEKVTDLEERRSHTRPSTANADSGYAGTESLEHEPPSSSPELQAQPKTPGVKGRKSQQSASAASHKLQGMIDQETPVRSKRQSMIFSQQHPSTQALRTVYLENAQKLQPVQSFQSLLSWPESQSDEDGQPSLNSPRLSVLSESSFPSIYSPKEQQLSPDRYAWEGLDDEDTADAPTGPRGHLRHDSIKRVSQWISERDEDEGTPTKSNSTSTPLANEAALSQQPPSAVHPGHYQSLNNALQSVTQSPSQQQQSDHASRLMTHARKQMASSRSPRPTSFGGAMFGEPLDLPPTPDSVSTRMLRASRSSIADDRSLLDTTPAVVKGYDALVKPPGDSAVRTAPRQMRSSVEMRSAYASNLQYRTDALDALCQNESSDGEDDAAIRRQSGTIDDFDLDYDGFPDGKSILMGTPRRFLKHSKPPVGDMLFDGSDALPAQAAQQTSGQRQSGGRLNSPTKPRLSRVETSPSMFNSLGQMVANGKATSAESITSPRSMHSGSSGNRTVTQVDEHRYRTVSPAASGPPPTLSPGLTSPGRSRASPSPARRLSQKAGTLFRRLSNSHGSDREKTALPTLTSSPASTFACSGPAEIKRPRTSHGNERPSTRSSSNIPRPPSSRDTRRPSLQMRTKTEPGFARPPSSLADNPAYASDREKRSLFKRNNSQKTQDVASASSAAAGNDSKGGKGKRRGSIRDAVSSARRPWRQL